MHHTTNQSRRQLLCSIAGAGLASMAGTLPFAAHAADPTFPSRPIRMVVAFNPGSGSDMQARVIAQVLSESTGQPVIVDNRAGANGIVAVQSVLNAPADGYTMLFGSNSTFAINAALIRNMPYDPIADFTPLSLISSQYCMVLVPADSPYKTMADLIADARKRPGALNNGAGSPGYNLWSTWLNELTGIKTVNIQYKGGGEVVSALLGKQVDYAVAVISLEMIKSGKLRALAVSGPKRMPSLPGVPTMAEAGVPEFQAFVWTALGVSAKTPQPIVRQLEAAVLKAARSQASLDFLQKQDASPMAGGPEQMRNFQREEIQRWKRIVAANGIELQ
ncbi:tripartite tricarboxylate transporter substrate binding protein [Variovorax sp. dw_954]|uniref:Bug family tripartite tricarboxylate transporter substrate binding protein n=1 Tax=Variovorax sp. dw_954 TaxID=2720078 RepID=UPI001BD61E02|nr:tripartite tricarboxylate transporter substrate binding protein [Variovorax sp. dw_954]